jgi:D-glycero-alpha-D-manno-heptose-7-phosphate kinase
LEKIIIKSPTRVDLAGGTLDMWPLYNFVDGATTINVAIDIWTICEVMKRSDSQVVIESADLNKIWKFTDWVDFFSTQDEKLIFYQSILKIFEKDLVNSNCGLYMKTASESPIGGGLGGSSSLVISVLKAILKHLGIEQPSPYELVSLAHNIESKMLRTPTGTQDYFPAVTGGLSFIEYGFDHIDQKVSMVSETPIKDHFLLVYTGRSHHSGLNNFEVLKSSVEGDPKVLSALKKIKNIALKMKKAITHQKWKELPELFLQEYEARLQLTPAFSSPEIEKLNELCLSAGAEAVKICGAGGGGCVLVWVAPEFRESVINRCRAENFTCLDAKPVDILT